MAFDAQKYKSSYEKDNYDRVTILVPKGRKADLKQAAIEWDIRDAKGQISVSQMFIRAVERQYGVDLSKPEKEEESPG